MERNLNPEIMPRMNDGSTSSILAKVLPGMGMVKKVPQGTHPRECRYVNHVASGRQLDIS